MAGFDNKCINLKRQKIDPNPCTHDVIDAFVSKEEKKQHKRLGGMSKALNGTKTSKPDEREGKSHIKGSRFNFSASTDASIFRRDLLWVSYRHRLAFFSNQSQGYPSLRSIRKPRQNAPHSKCVSAHKIQG